MWTCLRAGSSLNAGSGRGASVNKTTGSGHDTALHLAAAKGHADVARELVKAGADFRSKAKNGWTPLHTAMFHNSAAVARILLRAGADPLSETEVRSPHLDVCLEQELRLRPKAFPRLTNSASLHVQRGNTGRTLSEGPGKWRRESPSPRPESPDDSAPTRRLSSPGRQRVDEVVQAREAHLFAVRERKQAARDRERAEGAEAALAQRFVHRQRRDEKRRQLENSLELRRGTGTVSLPSRSGSGGSSLLGSSYMEGGSATGMASPIALSPIGTRALPQAFAACPC